MVLPDGRLQTVSYIIDGDKGGFSANVHYTGNAIHPHRGSLPKLPQQNESPGFVTKYPQQNENPGSITSQPHQGPAPSHPQQDKRGGSITRTYHKLTQGASLKQDSEKSVRYVPHKSFQ